MNSNQEPLNYVSKSSKAALYMCAKCVAIITLALAPFSLAAQENAARPTTVLIHPGQTLYITFQRTGDTLTLEHVGTDTDKAAQLVLKMAPLKEIHGTTLNVQNNFDKNLHYKAEIHSLSKNKKASTSVVPVRAGKFAFESWPYVVEELELSGFELKDK
jgi:NADH dehydrogenase/NADH:ubiquinone oxidoreductase subunit G